MEGGNCRGGVEGEESEREREGRGMCLMVFFGLWGLNLIE